VKEKYSTLSVLYSLVRDSLHPTQFACKPTEIISYHNLAWDTILKHLAELSEEGLIIYTVPSVITITGSGIDKMKELYDNETSQEISAIEKVA
jgi:predicted transcriptional regulator